MSEYLTIKKNDVNIACWCRSSYEFQALKDYSPFDKWATFTPDKLKDGIEWLRDKKEEYQQQLEDLNKILPNLHYEEALECLENIKELREEYENIQAAIHTLQVIKDVCEEKVYAKNDWDHELPIVLEWIRD